jgi:hypothetical protein
VRWVQLSFRPIGASSRFLCLRSHAHVGTPRRVRVVLVCRCSWCCS